MHNLSRFLNQLLLTESATSSSKNNRNNSQSSSDECIDRKKQLHGGVNFVLGDIDNANSLVKI